MYSSLRIKAFFRIVFLLAIVSKMQTVDCFPEMTYGKIAGGILGVAVIGVAWRLAHKKRKKESDRLSFQQACFKIALACKKQEPLVASRLAVVYVDDYTVGDLATELESARGLCGVGFRMAEKTFDVLSPVAKGLKALEGIGLYFLFKALCSSEDAAQANQNGAGQGNQNG